MAKNVLIFGGGTLQLSIIERAKQLGYYTIVIDPDGNALAKGIADQFIVVHGDDFETTKSIAIRNNVEGIVTTATDKPILMMCRVAEEIGLIFPSYKSCNILLDKGKFKEFIKEIFLPHANGYLFESIQEVDNDLFHYPVIVKPVTNSGSRGVLKCDNKKYLFEIINQTLEFCKDGSFIIEEFIEGEEISVEAIVFKNTVYIIQITDKIVTAPPYNVELGHIQPSKYLYLKNEISKLLQKVVDSSGLNNCAIHPELKVNNDGITIIEIGPRLGGDYITSHLVPLSTGTNMEEVAINIATNTKFVIKRKEMTSMISYLNFPSKSEIKNVISEEELIEKWEGLISYKCSLSIGEQTQTITNSLNRYGHYILQAKTKSRLLELNKKVSEFISNRYLK